MNSQRIGTHLISTVLLLLWGGVLLYFHASGRIVHYLSSDGLFRPMALWGGIGMVVLGLFNLATIGTKESACCEHDHDHDHHHDHDHDHDHSHKEGECCGHDHHHDHVHEPKHGCCDHDHGHGHGHSHGPHDHVHAHDEEGAHGHSHGILEESGSLGRLVAILLLAVPMTYAAIRTPDAYSPEWRELKDTREYGKGGTSGRFEKNNAPASAVAAVATTPASKTVPAPAPAPAPAVASTPPVDSPKAPAPATTAKAPDTQAPKGADAKSFGSFTLADLKSQVPQSPEGNFMLEVPELYYTAGDKEVQGVLTGQPVETIAQVLPEKVNNEKGTRLRIFRLLIQCCAADARPYSIPVEFGKTAPSFKDMTWVKVTGKMSYKKENDQTVPIIEATSMTETAEPANGMVY